MTDNVTATAGIKSVKKAVPAIPAEPASITCFKVPGAWFIVSTTLFILFPSVVRAP